MGERENRDYAIIAVAVCGDDFSLNYSCARSNVRESAPPPIIPVRSDTRESASTSPSFPHRRESNT
jgi:hypothetical protein